MIGDSASASVYYERALAIQRRLSGETGVRTAITYTNLAMLLRETGDFAGARNSFRRGLAGLVEGLKAGHPYYAIALGNLASLVLEGGDVVNAEHLQRQTLRLRLAALGPHHAAVARSKARLGTLALELGELDEAGELLWAALEVQEKTVGRRHPEISDTLLGLARLHAAQGDPPGARSLLERALVIFESLDENHPRLIEPLTQLVRLDLSRGDIRHAQQSLNRGLAIADGLARQCRDSPRSRPERACGFGAGRPQRARLLTEQARIHLAQGERSEALDAALEATRTARVEVRRNVRSLAERDALYFAETMSTSRDLAISLLASGMPASPATRAEVWDAVIRSRALVLRETMARQRLLNTSQDPELRELARHWNERRQVLTDLLVGAESGSAIEPREVVIAARVALDAEQAMAEQHSGLRHGAVDTEVGLEAVAGRIPPDSALVAITRFEHTSSTEPNERPITSYLAFVLVAGSGEPATIALGPAAGIDADVGALRAQAIRGTDDARSAEDEFRNIGGRLRDRVWDAVRPHLAGARRVFVVPDGSLNLLNLAILPAMHDGTKEIRYLLDEGPLIHYLTTERELVLLSKQQPATPEPLQRRLLAVGGVDFNDRARSAESRTDEASSQGLPAVAAEDGAKSPWASRISGLAALVGTRLRDGCGLSWYQDLPQTRVEIDELEKLWLNSDATTSLAVNRITREADFKRAAPSHQVLHLATHGFFLGEQCAGKLRSGMDPSITAALSGLALAGANNRGAGADEEDGILTAGEIAMLDLSGVEWAVLSACSTGVGETRTGEGVFGLRRAFRIAGARTVIMSLWPVEDESARRWMKALYKRRFTDQLATVEAVHQASLDVLRSRRGRRQSTHPYFWGAFIAAGDWRGVPRITRDT